MKRRSYNYDVVVIGGGLSGIAAAESARSRGARVALLTDGGSMLELASGCIDLMGADCSGSVVEKPWDAIAALAQENPEHPYALVGADQVRLAVAAFQGMAAEAGLNFKVDGSQANQWIVTALGHLKPTYLVQEGVATPQKGKPVRVIGFRGMREFHPGVFAEGLRKSLPDTQVTAEWLELPPHPLAEKDLTPMQVARLLEDRVYRERVTSLLKPVTPAPALVLFPAVLGLSRAAEVRAEFSRALGAPVAEVPLLAPSLPGLRLSQVLHRYLENRGVDVYSTCRVNGSEAADGRVSAVYGEAAGRKLEFRAKAFVLATGGLLGKGLVVEGKGLKEPIFNLPVEAPQDGADHWASQEMMPTGGHAFVRCGIRTDEQLRPQGWANLHVSGRMLAGCDPYAAYCGGGVAVATGWRAGQLAGGAVE